MKHVWGYNNDSKKVDINNICQTDKLTKVSGYYRKNPILVSQGKLNKTKVFRIM